VGSWRSHPPTERACVSCFELVWSATNNYYQQSPHSLTHAPRNHDKMGPSYSIVVRFCCRQCLRQEFLFCVMAKQVSPVDTSVCMAISGCVPTTTAVLVQIANAAPNLPQTTHATIAPSQPQTASTLSTNDDTGHSRTNNDNNKQNGNIERNSGRFHRC